MNNFIPQSDLPLFPFTSKEESSPNVVKIESEHFIRIALEKDVKEGFSLLFQHYHTILCNHAIRYVWSKDVAKDIVADVFFNLWKNQEFTQITSSYRSYLFGAVRNGCHNYLSRELSRHASVELLDNYDSQSLRPDQIVHFDELQHKIETTISNLPPQCKRVFLLNRFECKKYSEIAADLNISVKTVEMHISKALQTLRDALKEEWILALCIFSTFFQ